MSNRRLLRGKHVGGDRPRGWIWPHVFGPDARLPAWVAALVTILAQVRLSSDLQLRPVWLVPALAAGLLIVSIALYALPGPPGPAARAFGVGLASVLVVGNLGSLSLLVHGVFVRSALTPAVLIRDGASLWLVNLLVFAIVYWELDGGGPQGRLEQRCDYPDFVFPQQEADRERVAPPDWRPSFGDYLFLSLTNATAFSPTDTMPYTIRAKFAMGVQALFSLTIVAVLVARAVNVARG
jgi:hypothetical protein